MKIMVGFIVTGVIYLVISIGVLTIKAQKKYWDMEYEKQYEEE